MADMGYTGKQKREYQREWMRKRRESYFAGKTCMLCGSQDRLELDHVDPSTKELAPAALWSMSDQNPKKITELAKCRILCYDCHLVKSKTESPKGIQHGSHRLTDAEVLELRRIYAEGRISIRDLADIFNVSRATIHDAVRKKTWKHVGETEEDGNPLL